MSGAGGRRRGVVFRGAPPWAPRRKAAQVKGEEARNKLNTTSRSAYVVPDSGVTNLRGLEARGVLIGHTDRRSVGGVPQDGVGHACRFEASPGVSAVLPGAGRAALGERRAGGGFRGSPETSHVILLRVDVSVRRGGCAID